MGLTAIIRRWRQQDALEAAYEAIEALDRQILSLGRESAARNEIFAALKAEVAKLEGEILRLRKNSLTPPPKQVDDSIVKARSTADVRRLTENAFGLEMLRTQEQKGESLDS